MDFILPWGAELTLGQFGGWAADAMVDYILRDRPKFRNRVGRRHRNFSGLAARQGRQYAGGGQTRQAELARRDHVAELFNRAVGQLKDEKLEVRLGAIF
jgi:hypothetical protein